MWTTLLKFIFHMKVSQYCFFEEILPSEYLHYSSLSNSFLLLNESCHKLFEDNAHNVDVIKAQNQKLFDELVENQFIIEDSVKECENVLIEKKHMIDSYKLYNVVINTTLDCNLSCWYCYENRIAGSKLSNSVIDAIKKNIYKHYKETNFETLKLSFFGGEPFLYFDGIKQLLDYAKLFCSERNIELIADFTTNSTLITTEQIKYLKQFRCHFQITLDGGHNCHNKIKIDKMTGMDTYAKTIRTLKEINDNIDKRWIAVRVNFDNRTLRDIDEIINDIDFLDRKKTYIIIKKVWQLKTEKVNSDALKSAIQAFFEKKFLVDYYFMPKGCVCFAERKNQVLFNYDGKIFKCTTIPKFNDENALGKLDLKTGNILWNKLKMKDWYADIQPYYCKTCKWFPACLGICNRQLLAHQEKICTFDACNLTPKEYLMYLFKYNVLKSELYES